MRIDNEESKHVGRRDQVYRVRLCNSLRERYFVLYVQLIVMLSRNELRGGRGKPGPYEETFHILRKE